MTVHPSDLSDDDLVSLCTGGDGRAWEVLVMRYRRLVWSVALGRGLPEADAEDAFQATWLKVHQNLPSLRSTGSLAGWIAAVARSQCSRLHRRSALDRRASAVLEERARARGPGDAADDAEAFQGVAAAVDRLAGRCRDLLRLLYWEEASYDDVTKRLGLARGSVGPTRARCLEKLRTLVEGGAR